MNAEPVLMVANYHNRGRFSPSAPPAFGFSAVVRSGVDDVACVRRRSVARTEVCQHPPPSQRAEPVEERDRSDDLNDHGVSASDVSARAGAAGRLSKNSAFSPPIAVKVAFDT
jgi:hypothetical protein